MCMCVHVRVCVCVCVQACVCVCVSIQSDSSFLVLDSSVTPPSTTTPLTPAQPHTAVLTEDETIPIKGFKSVMVKTMTASGKSSEIIYLYYVV